MMTAGHDPVWSAFARMYGEFGGECLQARFKRQRKLLAAIMSGKHADLWCYCLTRSLPPLMERPEMSNERVTYCVDRAHRWYKRLLPVAEKFWKALDAVPVT